MSPTFRRLCLALPAVIFALGTGCAQLDMSQPVHWPWELNDRPGTPTKVVAMWTDTVLYQPNSVPDRGFGGRLMFYGEEGEKPIKVDGSLVIYAFEENGRARGDAKPDRKYVFTSEQLTKHYGKSDLGHSYSIWLPWDKVGGEQKEISLIARFTPKQGPLLVGKQSRYILPGWKKPPAVDGEMLAQRNGNSMGGGGTVQSTSYVTPIISAAPGIGQKTQRMSSTTISIPSRFGQRPPVAVVRPPANQPPFNRQLENRPQWSGASMSMEVPQPAPSQPMEYPHQAAFPQQGPSGQTFVAPQAPEQPQAHFSRPRYRPRGESVARLSRDRAGWQQRPVESPFRREPAHPLPRAYGSSENSANAGPYPNSRAAAPSWNNRRPHGG